MAMEVLSIATLKARVQTAMPSLRSIEGAASLEQALASGARVSPAAFIIPLAEKSGVNQLATSAVQQRITASFAVVLSVRDYGDARGDAAISHDLSPLRVALLEALMGFAPGSNWDAITHAGGTLLQIKNGNLFWQDKFMTETHRRSL